MRFPYTVFTITNQFQTPPGGGGGDPLVEVTVNSKEENSLQIFERIRPQKEFWAFGQYLQTMHVTSNKV